MNKNQLAVYKQYLTEQMNGVANYNERVAFASALRELDMILGVPSEK